MKELFRRKYLISFFYIIVSVIGILVWRLMPIENTPELNLPKATVTYSWGRTAPEVVEQEITRKVEQEVNRLRDVTEVDSRTTQGRSSVTVTFNKNAPVEYRVLELREYLAGLTEELPSSVRPPTINRQVPEELQEQQTFIVYTLNGDLAPRALLEYAEKRIRNKLLSLEGLSAINITGVSDPVLIVEFDREQVERYRMSVYQIMQNIRTQFQWRTAGFADQGSNRYSIILPPNYNDPTDIERLDIQIPNTGKIIKLGDIATVSIQESPERAFRRLNGDPALTISFEKESGADAFTLAESILAEMEIIKAQLPAEMNLRLQVDSTEELRSQFDDLQLQAIISAFLVFLVVILFVRKLRAPLVIIGSVLFSILLSVITLYLMNYSLNIFTLAGLTIALGMMIDNAVVVFEHLNPSLPSGSKERLEHIKKELPNAVVPVLGATFTTVGIFIPLLFALEELRIFLMPLAVALTTTLVSSVFIAFTWIPYSLVWLTPDKKEKHTESRQWGFSNHFLLRFFALKSKLRWVLVFVIIGVIGIPVFAIEEPDWSDEEASANWPEFTQYYFDNRDVVDTWLGGVTRIFFEETRFGRAWGGYNTGETIRVSINPPQGTPLEEIDKIVRSYENVAKPYADAFEFYEVNANESYGARMSFEVKPEYLYRSEPYVFFGEAMYLGARTGNVVISVSGFNQGNTFGSTGSNVSQSITLEGYSYNELLNLAKDLKRRLEKNRRVREVDISGSNYWSRDDYYQYYLSLDEEEILSKGLTKSEVSRAISMDLNPEFPFGRIEFQGQDMNLIGRMKQDKWTYEENLMQEVRNFGDLKFNMDMIGQIEKQKELTQIVRNNQSYRRTVTFNFLGSYQMSQDFVESVVESTPVPVGSKIVERRGFFGFGGSEENKNYIFIALLSVLSVWMIVSALLESFKYPLFVIMAVPFSFIGIMTGSLFNELTFDRGAISGALLSIGVVVNNAILIYHQKQLENGKGIFGFRAWVYVYRKRMRAILITTITTVSGLLPMMILGGDEFWENLAIVVIWGLSFSTVILLIMTGVRAGREEKKKKISGKVQDEIDDGPDLIITE